LIKLTFSIYDLLAVAAKTSSNDEFTATYFNIFSRQGASLNFSECRINFASFNSHLPN